jgi:nucleotidyltransferase/DNA polymerase involved in DNA repair
MSRIACLRIPQFQIAVHQKHEPDLKNTAFVVLENNSEAGSGRAKIFMCSDKASQKNIIAGMRLSEAKAVLSTLNFRKYESQLYQAAQKKLIQEFVLCSPKVSADQLGVFLLDASGLSHLGGENTFCRNLLKAASKAGFTNAHVGIADSAFAAEVASRLKNKRWHIVPKGCDKEVLAPLSIWHLPVSHEMKEALSDLGIKTMSQLLAIPVPELIERFGLEALFAINLAQGFDKRRPHLPPQEKHFECSVELGAPMEALNETLFILKSMVDRLLVQLRKEDLVAEELILSFYNDNDKFDERPVKLLRPSGNSKFLLEVLKLSLEAKPLMREYTAITLSVSRFTNALWEQQEFDEVANNKQDEISQALLLMLQRFNTRLGENVVVKPLANDQYMPEHAGMWVPVLDEDKEHPVLPLNNNYLKVYNNSRGNAANLVLKQHKEPIPILVRLNGLLPGAIAYQGQWYRINQVTIPDRLSGLWWQKAVYKSYYMVEADPQQYKQTGTSLMLLTEHNNQGKSSWFMEGYYD